MRIAIRVDASGQIGTGHVMRCLTLADALKQQGAEIRFVSHRLPEQLQELIVAKGHEFASLNNRPSEGTTDNLLHFPWLGTSQAQDATETIQVLSDQTWDWLVVDHYALDAEWESAIRPEVGKIMVIDDLADRPHDCDLLLDQNYHENPENRYRGLVPDRCRLLFGLRFALLRREFREAQKNLRERDGRVRRILVFFGGTDPDNVTEKTLLALSAIHRPDIMVDVVIGGSNPHKERIRRFCAGFPNFTFYCQTEEMALLMAEADLAIGGGGITTWERCAMGLPTLTLVLAENQREITVTLESAGATVNLGSANQITVTFLASAIQNAINNPVLLKKLSVNSRKLFQIEGGERELLSIMELMGRDDGVA
jgi:UDP-2,4-diacetamido-2,4,6-trideoxy-beta-L-altropyranose hydrolase